MTTKLVSTGVEFPDATTQTTSGLPLTGGALTGAVTTTSTFDGRDVAADGVTADAALPKAGGTMTGDVSLGDNVKAKFGAGDDLQIYHDGSDSWLVDNGTGGLKLGVSGTGTSGFYKALGSETIATFEPDGPVTLYNNNAAKLATTSTGIDVTGSVTCDGLTSETGAIQLKSTSGNTAIDIHRVDTSIGDANGLGHIRFTAEGSGSGEVPGVEIQALSDGAWSAGSAPGALSIKTTPSGAEASTERMRIDSSGNVGIGTSSPDAKLDVSANSPTIRLTETTQTSVWSPGDVLSKIETYSEDTSANGPMVTSFIKTVNEQAGGVLPSGALVFGTASYNSASGAVEKVRFPSTGGITFNGDTAAANALDDYEEGTFTPTIAFGGAAVGVVYTQQLGFYTKVGNLVTIDIRIVTSSKGTSVGSLTIEGLPFTSTSGTNYFANGSTSHNAIALAGAPGFYIGSNSVKLFLSQTTDVGTRLLVDDTNCTNAINTMLSASYRV